MSRRIVVIGGGVSGATVALDLTSAGCQVVLVERSPRLGGLVVDFEVGGTSLECFYHHVFPHEEHIQALISRLGLDDRLSWLESSVGVYRHGRLWPFTTPLDLLRFRPLPLLDRLRSGVGALRMGRVDDWRQLDDLPALEWLARYTGERAVDAVWAPLLRAKFGAAAGTVPAAWMWARFRQRSGGRGRSGGERLGYLRGGFRQLFDALAAELDRLGADVRTGSSVRRVVVRGGRAEGVELHDGTTIDADAVVYAGTMPGLEDLLPPEHVDPRWEATGALGVLCVVLELDQPLGSLYWTNVCDPDLPFGGVIEHTNLVPASDYDGRHIVYLGRYFTLDDPIASADPQQEAERWVDIMAERWPGFDRRHVLAVHPFHARYASPLVSLGYGRRLPPTATAVDGLFAATSAQIYPFDRGMSDGVALGQAAAADVLAHLEPVVA